MVHWTISFASGKSLLTRQIADRRFGREAAGKAGERSERSEDEEHALSMFRAIPPAPSSPLTRARYFNHRRATGMGMSALRQQWTFLRKPPN